MATLDEVLADIKEETTLVSSVGALIAGLRQQLTDALSGATLPPAVQAKVDQVFAQLESNKAQLALAVQANTPAAPATGGSETPPAPPAA